METRKQSDVTIRFFFVLIWKNHHTNISSTTWSGLHGNKRIIRKYPQMIWFFFAHIWNSYQQPDVWQRGMVCMETIERSNAIIWLFFAHIWNTNHTIVWSTTWFGLHGKMETIILSFANMFQHDLIGWYTWIYERMGPKIGGLLFCVAFEGSRTFSGVCATMCSSE